MSSPMRVSLLVLALCGSVGAAQEPMFDVASVKRAPTNAPTAFIETLGSGVARVTVPGQLRLRKMSLRMMVAWAYQIPEAREYLVDWSARASLRDEVFDIEAKGDPANDLRTMLRTLLTLRFGLRVHTETRTLPVYALTVKTPGRLGPGLTLTMIDCLQVPRQAGVALPPECTFTSAQRYGTRITRGAGPLAALLSVLQPYFQKPVVDATGLSGNVAWEFAAANNPSLPEVPNIFTALEDQLGLKVTETTAPVDVMVIDAVQMPTPN